MRMLNLIKRCFPQKFKTRVKHAMGFSDMETRLKNLRRAGFICTGAVDVGAFAGDWALLAHDVFDCPVVMVEPQPTQQLCLRALVQRKPFSLEPVALGSQVGTAHFIVQETNSRLSNHAAPGTIEVPVDRLDHLIARHAGLQANLLKVDVQGFELAVLEGGGDALKQLEVIILEVSVIRIGPVPVMLEVMQFMDRLGYRLYDFLPMYYRPLDTALWQGDAFFVRNDSALVASQSWD